MDPPTAASVAFVAAAPSAGPSLRAIRGAQGFPSQAQEPQSSTESVTSAGLALLGAAAVVATARHRNNASRSQRGVTSRYLFGGAAQEPAPAKPVFNPAAQLGAIAPLGYFDPLEFCKEGDEAAFLKLRANEIKHGRVAMLASLGLLAEHFGRVGHGSIGSMLTEGGAFGVCVILVFSAAAELSFPDNAAEPGNLGDPAGIGMDSTEMRTKELSNGRMAMLSVLGIFAAEFATGKDAFEQFGL